MTRTKLYGSKDEKAVTDLNRKWEEKWICRMNRRLVRPRRDEANITRNGWRARGRRISGSKTEMANWGQEVTLH